MKIFNLMKIKVIAILEIELLTLLSNIYFKHTINTTLLKLAYFIILVTVFHLSALYGCLCGHYTCYRGHRHVRHVQVHSRHAQRGSTPRHGHVINTVT